MKLRFFGFLTTDHNDGTDYKPIDERVAGFVVSGKSAVTSISCFELRLTFALRNTKFSEVVLGFSPEKIADGVALSRG